MNTLLKDISLEYIGAPGFYDFHEQYAEPWRQGERIPPGHQAVGRLVIDPALTAQASAEISQMAYSAEVSNNRLVEKELSFPFLQEFVQACETRFKESVQYDTDRYRPRSVDSTSARITVGPYSYRGSDRWHFDNTEAAADAVYTLAVLGPTTVFATDHLCLGDFDEQTFLINPIGLETVQYPVGTITVHHANRTAHSVPGPEHNGQRRIFMNRRLYSALPPNDNA